MSSLTPNSSKSNSATRKGRSKSHDESDPELKPAVREQKTRSKSHDDSLTASGSSSGSNSGKLKRGTSKRGGMMMSLEDGLSRVPAAAPSLIRKDFGRGADDDDTFCGTGTVDGEVKRGKLNVKTTSTGGSGGGGTLNKNNRRPNNPFGGAPRPDPFGGKSAFGLAEADENSDDEDDDNVDFFAGASNPFRDFKKKSPSKRTIL